MDGLVQLWVTMEILLGDISYEEDTTCVRSRLEITTWPSDLNPSNDNYCYSSDLTVNLLSWWAAFLSNLTINLLSWCAAFLSNLTINLLSWRVAFLSNLTFNLPSWWAALFYLAYFFCSLAFFNSFHKAFIP